MKAQSVLLDFILREWLPIASGVGFLLTSLSVRHFPAYSIREMQVLFILFALFAAVKGLQDSGLISWLSKSMERGRTLPLKLVAMTFFLSMLVTNDVALIVIVPLTLSLHVNRRDVLVILEVLAANAGSALTPFGNPQNLFLYLFYDLHVAEFVTAIAPFSFAFLLILALASLTVKVENNAINLKTVQRINKSSTIYGSLLIAVLLSVLHVLPISTGLLVVIYALLFDRNALRVDYALLLSFFFFFGLAENMKVLLASEIEHSEHVFLFSALASQIMNNVPAALLFAKFTTHWKALLWGTNAGGFGSLFGSFANLIAYRIYILHENTNDPGKFTAKFLIIGYAALFFSIGLYFALQGL